MKVLLKSINDSIFNTIDQTNIVSNDKGESVTFEKGFYSLSQIIDILNTMMYSQFSYQMMLIDLDVFISHLLLISR